MQYYIMLGALTHAKESFDELEAQTRLNVRAWLQGVTAWTRAPTAPVARPSLPVERPPSATPYRSLPAEGRAAIVPKLPG
jgi:hypothetical protein